MKKVCLSILLVIPFSLIGQKWEFGALIGASNYSGDLAPDPIVIKETHFAGGGILRYNVNKYVTIKSNLYYGRISGNDDNSQVSRKRIRNLNFRSNMLDVGLQGEINLTGFEITNPQYTTSPYIFAGLSIFRFNPMALYNNEWVPLQPLGTEGQGTTKYNDREKYALTQISIPFGAGYKIGLNRNWAIGLEFGFRKTFTDYLDDVSKTYVEEEILRAAYGELSYRLSNRSGEVLGQYRDVGPRDQRGNSTTDDWYIIGGITITYTVLPNTCFKFN